MRRVILATMPAIFLAVAVTAPQAQAQRWPPPPPNISGTWYMNGDPNLPCQIEQRDAFRVLLTNENGSAAWGSVRGNEVWIPEWTDGTRQGLLGRIRGNRIVWPNGTFWSR